MSIRTSSADSDPYKDDVCCYVTSYTTTEILFSLESQQFKKNYQMLEAYAESNIDNTKLKDVGLRGYEIFTMNYKVKWPLNLILSKARMVKYQVLFRHIFFCKYVERALCKTWSMQQSFKDLH